MIKFDIITIFPEQIESFASVGVLRIAQNIGAIQIKAHNLRNWTHDKHKSVDDRPFGGGAGMILKVAPIKEALDELKTSDSKVILMSASGEILDQDIFRRLSGWDKEKVKYDNIDKHYIIICGHYEGVDDRVREHLVDIELSVGKYVLSGGELPALILADGITRLLPGVLGNELSPVLESYEGDLLDYPQWTRPADFEGWQVPDVLLKGNHQDIDTFRKKLATKLTQSRTKKS